MKSENLQHDVVRPAVVMLALMTVLTGVVYPLAVTGLAQVIWPAQANGSLLDDGGRVVGSSLIGQPFDDPEYFWGRPSATAPYPYNAGASSGSNLAATNPALHEAVRGRVAALRDAGVAAGAPIPVDLVTASASGLDPHISVAAAEVQLARVVKARGLGVEAVQDLVRAHTEGRQWWLLGESRVNVLMLNLALDRTAGSAP